MLIDDDLLREAFQELPELRCDAAHLFDRMDELFDTPINERKAFMLGYYLAAQKRDK